MNKHLLAVLISGILAVFITFCFCQSLFVSEGVFTDEITIKALTEANDRSSGDTVYIEYLLLDGVQIDSSNVQMSSDWDYTPDSHMYSCSDPQADNYLRFKPDNAKEVVLTLLQTDFSGIAEINVNGKSEKIDLYRDTTEWTKDIHYYYPPDQVNWGVGVLVVCVFTVIFDALYELTMLLRRRSKKAKAFTDGVIDYIKHHRIIMAGYLSLTALSAFLFGAGQIMWSGRILMFLITAAFFMLIILLMRRSGVFNVLKSLSAGEVCAVIAISAVTIGIMFGVIDREHYVYTYDSSGYWVLSLNWINHYESMSFKALPALYTSICVDEYNGFIPSITAFPLMLLGKSYLSYIIINTSLYLVPANLTLAAASKLISEKLFGKKSSFVVLFAFFSMAYILIYPTLFGYSDITCVLVTVNILALTLNSDFRQFKIKRCLEVSASVLWLILMRRAFCYWVIQYIMILVAWWIIEVVREKEKKKEVFFSFIKNYLVIGGVCSALLAGLFPVYIKSILEANIHVAHSAWGHLYHDYKFSLKYIGAFTLLLIVLGAVAIWKNRKSSLMCAVTIPSIGTYLIAVVTSYFLNYHSLYRFIDTLMVIIGIGISWIYSSFTKKNAGRIAAYGIVAVDLLNMMQGLSIVKIPDSMHILTDTCFTLRNRDDIVVLSQMSKDISDNMRNGKNVYCVASSEIISDDTIRNTNLPEMDYSYYMPQTAVADLRDGFPTAFLKADVLYIADPIQYHLMPDDTQVIIKLAQMILEPSPISEKYELIKEYEITSGVKVKVFQKTDSLSAEDIEYVSSQFSDYQDYPELFKDRIDSYAAESVSS